MKSLLTNLQTSNKKEMKKEVDLACINYNKKVEKIINFHENFIDYVVQQCKGTQYADIIKSTMRWCYFRVCLNFNTYGTTSFLKGCRSVCGRSNYNHFRFLLLSSSSFHSLYIIK